MISTTKMIVGRSTSIVIFRYSTPSRGRWPPGSDTIIHHPDLILASGWCLTRTIVRHGSGSSEHIAHKFWGGAVGDRMFLASRNPLRRPFARGPERRDRRDPDCSTPHPLFSVDSQSLSPHGTRDEGRVYGGGSRPRLDPYLGACHTPRCGRYALAIVRRIRW